VVVEAASKEVTPALLHVPDVDFQGLIDVHFMAAEVDALLK
jgi:hypothetical protein